MMCGSAMTSPVVRPITPIVGAECFLLASSFGNVHTSFWSWRIRLGKCLKEMFKVGAAVAPWVWLRLRSLLSISRSCRNQIAAERLDLSSLNLKRIAAFHFDLGY